MDTDHIQDVVNQPEIPDKQPDYGKNPTITDQNIAVMLALASGKTTRQLARELGVTDGAISWHKAKFRDLVQLKANNQISDPINDSRARISGKLKRFERVLDYTVKPEVFKRDVKHLAIAAQTSIAGLKGLGVLQEHVEAKRESLEERRLTVIHKLELAEQFGGIVPAELRAELTADKQPTSNVQADVPDSGQDATDQPVDPIQTIDSDTDQPA